MKAWQQVKGWTYNYLTDLEVIEYLKFTYPSLNITQITEQAPDMIEDLYKYGVIFNNGGFYANYEIVKKKNFEKSMMQLSECEVIVGLEGVNGGVTDLKNNKDSIDKGLIIDQAAFYSDKNHPFMRFIFERVARQVEFFQIRSFNLTGRDIGQITGEATWTDSLVDYILVTMGINIKEELQCGGSYKFNDICILNVKPFKSSSKPFICDETISPVKSFRIITY